MSVPRILVVEDERIVAAGLRKRLQALGYEVVALAPSGEEAVRKAEALRPDLVLMDIQLEGEMDGTQAAALIRSRFRIPVVFLTAYSTTEVLERAKVTEPYGYILKPYEDRELHVVVETALYKHRMERALQERGHWLAALLKSIGDGIVATDGECRITFMNPMAERLTGWEERDAKGRPLAEVFNFVHEETRHRAEGPLPEAIRENRSVPMAAKMVLIAKGGTARPVEDCATPITDEGGAALGGVMVFRDLTPRRQAEEREREHQRFRQAMLDTLPAHISVLDGEGTVVAVNEGWRRFASENGAVYLRTEIGTNYLEVCRNASGPGSDGAAAAAEGIRAVLDGSSPRFSLEYPCHSPTEQRWFIMVVVPLKYGEARAIVTHLNMTDRKRAEAATLQLAAIVESSDDAIIGMSPDGVVTSWNGGAERLYGYIAPEIIGQPASILVPPDLADEGRVAREKTARGERVRPFETRRRRKDGKDVDVMASLSPVKDDAGRIVGVASIAQDITHVKKLERQFQQAQKMEAVGRLAGGVAHDFNNLLTVINGYSQVLTGVLHDHDKAREMAEEIHKAGGRAAGLTQQLLAYSRQQIQQLKVINLNDLLGNAEKMLRRLIGEDVELITVPAPGLHPVKADPGQIEQVVMNLVINARDAIPVGGTLTVETRNVQIEADQSDDVYSMQPGPYALLAVRDTGCGMDEATKARLFEPFFTTKGPSKGTGLGLATVYGIVKQSGGFIKVESEVGVGTTFKVFLPALQEAARTGGSHHGTPTLPTGTETVLLVEDEHSVRALTQMMLKQCGYTVLAASCGAEALELAARHEGGIDLLVTDVVMPKMSGRQVAEALRLIHPDLPVLYLSGYTDDTVFRHGVSEAETAFLQKPFTFAGLAKKVRDVLYHRGT